jgi:membrane protease subunit HflK
MPWNNGGPDTDGGGSKGNRTTGSGGQGPWGTPPGNGQNNRPTPGPWGGGPRGPGQGGGPDFDDLLARGQEFIRNVLPPGFGGGGGGGGPRRGGGGGFGGARAAALIVVVVVAAWLASGFYRVQPDEQGVVLRFGAYVGKTDPGLNYHLPWPIESVLLPAVTRINRVEIGYRSMSGGGALQQGLGPDGTAVPVRDVPAESLMLTGDENIIDINFAVFWRIRNASDFLFNTRNPEYAVKSAAESVMREVIGSTPIQPALGPGRTKIETAVTSGVQAILDQYGTGVEITQVSLQKSNPPDEVLDSFRDVQRANADAERIRNEAESYRNDIVPRARGDAARLTAEADGARQASVAEATGQGQRFLSVLKAYDAAKDVTLERLYLETMQDVLTHTPSVIVDDKLRGVVPLLPLNDLGVTPATPDPARPDPTKPGPAAKATTP